MEEKKIMTPLEFEEEMRKIRSRYIDNCGWDDEEICHEKMDELLCEMLRQLGYGGGVAIFDGTNKWYA